MNHKTSTQLYEHDLPMIHAESAHRKQGGKNWTLADIIHEALIKFFRGKRCPQCGATWNKSYGRCSAQCSRAEAQ